MDQTVSALSVIGNTLLAVGAWVLLYTGLPAEPAAILGTLMAIDFAAGCFKSHAIGRSITSQRMRVGLMSKFGVMAIPLVLALAAKGLGVDFKWIVNWSISLFILSETYSIISNIYTARTGNDVPEFDAVSAILKRVRALLNSLDDRC